MFKDIDKRLLGVLSAGLLAGGIAACESKEASTSYSGVSEETAVKKRAELREDIKGAAVKGEGLTAKADAHVQELRADAVQMNRDAAIKGMHRDLEAVEKHIEKMTTLRQRKEALRDHGREHRRSSRVARQKIR